MWGNSYRTGWGGADGVGSPAAAIIAVILFLGFYRRKQMESTVEGEHLRASGRRLKNDLTDGVSDIKAAASSEIKNLLADVEDLMARIADLKDADVVRVRGKVQRAVDGTKQSLSEGADAIRRQAREVASTAD